MSQRPLFSEWLLCGVAKCYLEKLQRVQNLSARLITYTRKFVLFKLHWLPVELRIGYKVLLLTFKALHKEAPRYVSDLLSFKNQDLLGQEQIVPLLATGLLVLLPQHSATLGHGYLIFRYSGPASSLFGGVGGTVK